MTKELKTLWKGNESNNDTFVIPEQAEEEKRLERIKANEDVRFCPNFRRITSPY